MGCVPFWVDGNPVCSCLLPASRLEGKTVTTVGGHAAPDLTTLHPVQKAMMACDGLQCGYCTPGFVNAGIAFFERWRKANGKSKPSREVTAVSLAGNLCRCGTYNGILMASMAACAGEYDEMPVSEVQPARVEAIEKVTGRARYSTDYQIEGMFHGQILCSVHLFAKVKSIDFSEAAALIDVLADKERTVRYVGMPIAAVAARDRETAVKALTLIKVEYEVYTAVIDFDQQKALAGNVTWGAEGIRHSQGTISWPEALASLDGDVIEVTAVRGKDEKGAGLTSMMDIDGNGAEELIMLEDQRDSQTISVWRWQGGNFSLLWRSENGRFHDLLLQPGTDDQLLLTVAP